MFVADSSLCRFEANEPIDYYFQTSDVKMIDLRLRVGCTPETPPELFAEELAERMKMEILASFAEQSILAMKT